jgi:hypothetical protein
MARTKQTKQEALERPRQSVASDSGQHANDSDGSCAETEKRRKIAVKRKRAPNAAKYQFARVANPSPALRVLLADAAKSENRKRYQSMRKEYEVESRDSGDNDDFDSDDDDDDSEGIKESIRSSLETVLEQGGVSSAFMRSMLANTIVQHAECDDSGDTEPHGLEVQTVIFSPLGLHRAMRVRMDYHRRSRCYETEFSFAARFDFLPPPPKETTDAPWIAGADRRIYPDSFEEVDAREHPHVADHVDVGFLCSNSFLDPPEVPGLGMMESADLWHGVENPNSSGISPYTVRLIRAWLLGDATSSLAAIDDKTLLTYVLHCVGALGLDFVSSGWSWRPSPAERRRIKDETGCGEDEDKECIGWLEHAVSLATGRHQAIFSEHKYCALVRSVISTAPFFGAFA